jgi:hypothetical protein
MRLLVDENIPRMTVDALRALGHDGEFPVSMRDGRGPALLS